MLCRTSLRVLHRGSTQSCQMLHCCLPIPLFLFGCPWYRKRIFFALNSLNDVMEKGSTARQYDNFRMQSLLTDDVPNAKHQAIRNVLHANSCCTCMTLEEHSLSLRGRPDKSQNKTEDLEQSTAMSTTF